MTDKVQKIREEVERRMNCFKNERNTLLKASDNNISLGARIAMCEEILSFIAHLQEEPVPKIFKDMLNAKTPVESLGISAEEHDKIIDLCLYGKEPEMVDIDDLPKEEPISNDLKEASRNYADKEKFRKEIEKLKSNLIHGACSSQIAMETRCKEEAYNEVLAILDTMQEEPVSDIDFEQELYKAFGQVKDFTLGMRIAKWFYDMGKQHQEPVSEDLGEYINELSKQFPEVSFAKLSRIAVRVAKWQEEQIKELLLSEVLPYFINGGEADEVVAKLEEVLNQNK